MSFDRDPVYRIASTLSQMKYFFFFVEQYRIVDEVWSLRVFSERLVNPVEKINMKHVRLMNSEIHS